MNAPNPYDVLAAVTRGAVATVLLGALVTPTSDELTHSTPETTCTETQVTTDVWLPPTCASLP